MQRIEGKSLILVLVVSIPTALTNLNWKQGFVSKLFLVYRHVPSGRYTPLKLFSN